MKTRLLISGLALSLALSGAAMADDQRETRYAERGDRTGHLERMARHLDLTDTQQEQLRATMEAYGPELRELRSQIREARRNLRDSGGDGFNEEAARTSAERLGQLTGEAAFLRARMRADMGEILTDEQQAKLAEKRRFHRGGHRGKGRFLYRHSHQDG